MGQLNKYFRVSFTGHGHWCPGCEEMHVIPSSWNFNNDLDNPTFSRSVKITGLQIKKDEKGKWTGEWAHGPKCCHYNLINGMLHFHGDCTHELKGKIVPLPELPEWLKD